VLIIADENVAAAEVAFAPFGEVRRLPADAITPAALRNADALIVRSRVRVDADLLAGSSVRFVGTATSGIDHVAAAALRRAGVAFAAAPGCNAQAVAEYVLAALLWWADRIGRAAADLTLGVVGVGHVGGRVVRLARTLGMNVLECDPPLARRAGDAHYIPLGDLLQKSDVVTLHVPLTHDGPDATVNLIDAGALARLRPGAALINTARGPVLDTAAAVAARAAGARIRAAGARIPSRTRLPALILDVWSGEPDLDPAWHGPLARDPALLLTPHIAGHTVEARIRGTWMVAEALARWIEKNSGHGPPDLPPMPLPPSRTLDLGPRPSLAAVVHAVCDPAADAAAFQRAAGLSPRGSPPADRPDTTETPPSDPPSPAPSTPAAWRAFRRGYHRLEFARHRVLGLTDPATAARLSALGFQV
jgi:erythronate-4-phosphate dehydrogenase